jgi:peptidoglycan-N-acetylglucosamine deacetylase
MLETLAAGDIRATFFLQGRWTRANPDVARSIAGAGHLIGNHSNFHAPMDALSDEWLRGDVVRAEETIRQVTGIDPKPWFRCPFGPEWTTREYSPPSTGSATRNVGGAELVWVDELD